MQKSRRMSTKTMRPFISLTTRKVRKWPTQKRMITKKLRAKL